jgi:hypothetical protein
MYARVIRSSEGSLASLCTVLGRRCQAPPLRAPAPQPSRAVSSPTSPASARPPGLFFDPPVPCLVIARPPSLQRPKSRGTVTGARALEMCILRSKNALELS